MLRRITTVFVALHIPVACNQEKSVDPNTHMALFAEENNCYFDFEEFENDEECSSNDDCAFTCGRCTVDTRLPACPPTYWNHECPLYFQEMDDIFCGCLNRKCVSVIPIENDDPCLTHEDCGDEAQCMHGGILEGYCVPYCTDTTWTTKFDEDAMCVLGDLAMDSAYCDTATGTCESL